MLLPSPKGAGGSELDEDEYGHDCAVLSAVIIFVYIIALMNYCNGNFFQAYINQIDGYDNS